MKTAAKVVIGVGVAVGAVGLLYYWLKPSKLSTEERKLAGDIASGGASGGISTNQTENQTLASLSNFASMAPYSSAFDRTSAFHGW
jgi:hypothetical protein